MSASFIRVLSFPEADLGLFGHGIARSYILVCGAFSLRTTFNARATLVLRVWAGKLSATSAHAWFSRFSLARDHAGGVGACLNSSDVALRARCLVGWRLVCRHLVSLSGRASGETKH